MTFVRRCQYFVALALFLLAMSLLLTVFFSSTLPTPKSLIMKTDIESLSEIRTRAIQVAKPESERSTKASLSVRNDSDVLMTSELFVPGHVQPHPELCPSRGTDLKLVIMVSSTPAHAEVREAVRLTWGHYAARSDISLAFFLGYIPEELKASIEEENSLYRDLVIGHFIDSYSNLTLKTLSMLDWFNAYCSEAPRLLKTDDDVFINIPHLLEYLATRKEDKKVIWGRLMKELPPFRERTSKYYLLPTQYPKDVLPDFTSGGGYVMTADCVKPMLELAPSLPYIRLEDVFVTGVLADQLGIKKVHNDGFYNRYMPQDQCVIQRGISTHLKNFKEHFDLWYKINREKISCD